MLSVDDLKLMGLKSIPKREKLISAISALRAGTKEPRFPIAGGKFCICTPAYLSDDEIGEQQELIHIGFKEPFTPLISHGNWRAMRASASKTQYFPVIAFVGSTSAGKSHLTNELLSFQNRRDHRFFCIASIL